MLSLALDFSHKWLWELSHVDSLLGLNFIMNYEALWSLILLFLISPDAFLLPATFLIKSPNNPPDIYKKRNKWNVLAYLCSFPLCWSIAIPCRGVCELNCTLLKTSVFRHLLTLCWTYNCNVRVWVEATQKIWPSTLFQSERWCLESNAETLDCLLYIQTPVLQTTETFIIWNYSSQELHYWWHNFNTDSGLNIPSWNSYSQQSDVRLM